MMVSRNDLTLSSESLRVSNIYVIPSKDQEISFFIVCIHIYIDVHI